MKYANVKSETYKDLMLNVTPKTPKFKLGNYARVSPYKNIFSKCYRSHGCEEPFLPKKVNVTVPLIYI